MGGEVTRLHKMLVLEDQILMTIETTAMKMMDDRDSVLPPQ